MGIRNWEAAVAPGFNQREARGIPTWGPPMAQSPRTEQTETHGSLCSIL
jgi:hypothetical protein